MPEEEKRGDALNNSKLPSWLQHIKGSWPVILISVVVSVVVTLGTVARTTGEGLQALGFIKSDALKLAEASAISNFSDNLTRMAWSRLYWADLYAARVKNKAAKEDIDQAWRAYIDSAAQWNANLMINIVGLERFYTTEKSIYFETQIQSVTFVGLDNVMGALRRNQDFEGTHIAEIFKRTKEARNELYGFVRCIAPRQPGVEKQPLAC